MVHPKPARSRGFTLIEALVALLVLSGGLIALSQLQIRALEASSATKAQTTAVNLAEYKLEELRGLDFAQLQSGSDQPDAGAGSNATFVRQWTVNAGASANLKVVSVTTLWSDADGRARSVSLTSLIARPMLAPIEPIAPAQTGGGSTGQ
jgi:prepilin-type N-terminal cleavage/methylation domain-containing protein